MKFLVPRKDKRGVIGIIILFVVLFSILILGFMATITVGVVDYASDIVTPVLEEIGTVGSANVSQGIVNTVGVVDGFVQSLPWLLAFAYGLALIFSIVFVSSYRVHPSPIFIGLYVAMILLLIFGAIIISNTYEDIYEGGDEIAQRLQENSAMSYLILYSPMILAIISFIAGIYLFASPKEEGGGVGGFSV